MALPTAALFSLLGAAAAAAAVSPPPPVPVPPSGPNFTLSVGVQCLTASGAGERALLTGWRARRRSGRCQVQCAAALLLEGAAAGAAGAAAPVAGRASGRC